MTFRPSDQDDPRVRRPDVARFLALLARPQQAPDPAVRTLFDGCGELVVARAPGRLDLMGGIADYSGSLVLQWPLAEAALVAAARPTDASDRRVRVISLARDGAAGAGGRATDFEAGVDDLLPGGRPLSAQAARELFRRDPSRAWAAYVVGGLLLLAGRPGARAVGGLRILVSSDVPEGKGVSSSAAIEVASLTALTALQGEALPPSTVAVMAQQVENTIVGAPCGIMDQMTSACGEQGRLLPLLCQPALLGHGFALPEQLEIWGIDSGVRHAVSGADYGSVRVGAFMGQRILADLANLSVDGTRDGLVRIHDPRWGGHLANVAWSEWTQAFASRVPHAIEGAAFLERWSGTADPNTRVDPARLYQVRTPTEHPIAEHLRVRLFRALLASLADGDALLRSTPDHRGRENDRGHDDRPALLGELMYQSHASYSACGLGSDATDRLVQAVRAAGPSTGLFGAKITGGGSGGTIAVLGRRGADSAIDAIAAGHPDAAGSPARVFRGSSPGAGAFGVMRLLHV